MTNVPAMLPLLHVAQAAIRVTTLDARVVALAALALVAALCWIWRPPMPRQRTAARGVLAVLVFLAVLPSVFPYDHLLVGVHAGATDAEEATHASHCHVSPATCSDAPITSGPGQLLFGAPIVVVPAMLAVLLLLTIPALTGITRRPEIRPPLLAAL
jgi:hypothetical protein